jgi:serine phosphatase RsbU (regulator of sigma subunit)
MLRRWKKVDLFIVLLFILTGLSFLAFRDLYQIFFWVLIVVLVLRVSLFLKRKLLWKTRNRLIFSGLFFVITPIVLILIFFLFIVYIIIAQYGVIIIDNLISRQVVQYEANVERYLVNLDENEMIRRSTQLTRFNPENLIIALYRKTGGSYQHFFVYPNGFDFNKLKINQYTGYFKINNTFYLGVLKKKGDFAVLISSVVDQDFLDQLSTISDFKIKFVKYDSHSSMGQKTDEIADMASNEEEKLFLPWPYKFKFIDFDQDHSGRIIEKEHLHWLLIDYDKIFQKIRGINTHSVQVNILKFIYFLIGLFATFIIISFFVGFRIIRVLTKSINLITRGTQKIRKGDFSFRIKIKSGDQLQYLAESFNEMASGIDRLLIEEKEKQRLEEELRIARSIQLKLLPKEELDTPEFEIAAVNIPAEEIAGDYFDYFYEDSKYMYILVADVSGKGTSAAFYMAELKGIMNYLQKKKISPAELISECHSSLSHSFDKVTFITINIAEFKIPEKKFILSRAGHTPALYYNHKKKQCIQLNPAGHAIGLRSFSKERIKEVVIHYQPGDILFLFSDGLSEIMNEADEMLGTENLKKIIEQNHHLSANDIKQKILDFSFDFSDSSFNSDDLTFIVLKVK